MEGLPLLVKALHTSILFILMFFACFLLYFSRLVQVVMKTALTVTLIIMMIVTMIPLVQVSVVAEVVELEVVVPEVEGAEEEATTSKTRLKQRWWHSPSSWMVQYFVCSRRSSIHNNPGAPV